MVDQEIIDLPNDDGQPFDTTESVPMQKNVGDTRNRTWDDIILGISPAISSASNVIKTTNTDISTDIQVVGTPIELPLTGNLIIPNSNFTISGNGIICNFSGRIRVTGIINNFSAVAPSERQVGQYSIAIDGVLNTVKIFWYNRNITGTEPTRRAGATLVEVIDVVAGEKISIFNTQVTGDDLVILADAGCSMLQIEIIQTGANLDDAFPFTWGASDEDSPLSTGILYTTEAVFKNRALIEIVLTLKNAPTGGPITIDILKETGVNTNTFASIFSTLPVVDVNEFTSQTSAVSPVFSDSTWESQRRLQIQLITNDTNFAATGLKGTLVTT